jgi:acylphosphatase
MKRIDMMTRRLRIIGAVQGVGYRDALRFEAERRALTGWVRNRIDGSVEALIQGAPEALEALIAWARRGPPAAQVVDVRIELPDDTVRYSGFERRPTV